MLDKRGREEVKEDLKDKIINSLTILDSEVFREAVERQNKDYANRFNTEYITLKGKIQKAPDYLRVSLHRQLDRIRDKAKKLNLIN